MISMLTAQWDEASLGWIEHIPERMGDALIKGLSLSIKNGMAYALRSSRSSIPKFEGDGEASLAIFDFESDTTHVSMTLGFKGKKWRIADIDVDEAPKPYNYLWGKEKSEPAKAHEVWLYNPKTGRSTAGRRKLVRYLKQQGGKWIQLPNAPTKETWNRKGTREEKKNFPPPYVYVAPYKTATDFITGLYKDHGDPLGAIILRNRQLITAIDTAWES